MSLTTSLNIALQGLQVNQRTMATISNNIANANTEGYSKQTVQLASLAVDGVGQGVRVEDVIRKVDQFLINAIQKQSSDVESAAVIDDYLERAQILFGEPGAENTIDEQIEIFFSNLQTMADSPDRIGSRVAVIEAADTLSREMSALALGMEELRFEADRDIKLAVDVINDALSRLATVNESLAEASAIGNPIATLLDQRDMLVEEIAGYIDIHTTEAENGTITMSTSSGIALLDNSIYQLNYIPSGTVNTLINNSTLQAIEVQRFDNQGRESGEPVTLVSAGTSANVVSRVNSGKLHGLLELRDQILPDFLAQLDSLAYTLRNEFNELHNAGSGYPAPSELNGTRLVQASQASLWTGEVRIAVLNEDGTPVNSAFPDESGGFRPLTMDMSQLDSGLGQGRPTTQTIIDEINNHFRTPQSKLSLGDLNRIELATNSDEILEATPVIELDFDLENITGNSADFWVNGVQVLDDTGADITNVSDTIPDISLNAASTFTTTAGSNRVRVAADAAHGLSVGDRVKLDSPGLAIDGIPAAEFDGVFVVQSVNGNTFDIDVVSNAVGGGTTGVAGQVAAPPYETVLPGDKTRTTDSGVINANVSGNLSSLFYDVVVDLEVRNADGTTSTTQATYRVTNFNNESRNDRFEPLNVLGGDGVITSSQAASGYMEAILVDENGIELGKTNGTYGDQSGYLKLQTLNGDYTIVIDQLNSNHEGLPIDNPPRPATNLGFSSYFQLNDFFVTADPANGTEFKNTALNMQVSQALLDNPTQISTGDLQLSKQPADPGDNPLYTYERFAGDSSIIQQMAGLAQQDLSFAAAGELPNTTSTINGYVGDVLGNIVAQTVSANTRFENQLIILEGYQERASAISGVNLDEEMANTILYQNAYVASARIITVTDELFETLLNAV
jgi:flagellar hook-associated protein 1 FlgK